MHRKLHLEERKRTKSASIPKILFFLVPLRPDGEWVGIALTETNEAHYNTCPGSKETVLETIKSDFGEILVHQESIPDFLKEWGQKIKINASGEDTNTSEIPLDFSGYSDKQVKVIKAVHLRTSVNSYSSYSEIADIAGLPNAQRFVGTTMRICRQPYIIPCHRVKNASFIRRTQEKPVRNRNVKRRVPV